MARSCGKRLPTGDCTSPERANPFEDEDDDEYEEDRAGGLSRWSGSPSGAVQAPGKQGAEQNHRPQFSWGLPACAPAVEARNGKVPNAELGPAIERVYAGAFAIPEFGTVARNIQQRQSVFGG